MKPGWPTDLTWYVLVYDWQTLIAGLIAIFAAGIAYPGSVLQINETQRAVLGRKSAYAAMAALSHLALLRSCGPNLAVRWR